MNYANRLNLSDQSEVLRYIDRMRHGVVMIVGSGKTFKTGTMYSIWEYCDRIKARRKAFLKPPVSPRSWIPEYHYPAEINSLSEALPDDNVVLDDMAVIMSSRKSGQNDAIQKFQGVISHKGIIEWGTIQTIASGDIAILRDQDLIFIHKYMQPSAIAWERPEYQKQCLTANRKIWEVNRGLQERGIRIDPLYISWCPQFNKALILDTPPEWYTEDQSFQRRNWIMEAET